MYRYYIILLVLCFTVRRYGKLFFLVFQHLLFLARQTSFNLSNILCWRKVLRNDASFREHSWVSILRHEVTGVARKHHIINIFFCSFGHWYRFADVSKMIVNRLSGIITRLFRFVYHVVEITPLLVSQQFAQLPCTPAFCITNHANLVFKTLKQISTEVMICYRYISILKNHTFVQLLNGKYQIPIAPPNDV